MLHFLSFPCMALLLLLRTQKQPENSCLLRPPGVHSASFRSSSPFTLPCSQPTPSLVPFRITNHHLSHHPTRLLVAPDTGEHPSKPRCTWLSTLRAPAGCRRASIRWIWSAESSASSPTAQGPLFPGLWHQPPAAASRSYCSVGHTFPSRCLLHVSG